MKIKFNLSQKLQLYIISVTVIFMIIAILFLSDIIRKATIKNAKQYTSEVVSKYSKEIELKFNSDMAVIRTLAKSLESLQWDTSLARPFFIDMYTKVLEENEQFDDIWDSREIKGIFPNYKNDFGRYAFTVTRNGNSILYLKELKSITGDALQYKALKTQNNENIEEPYMFSFTGNPMDEVLITDLTVPLNNSNGDYIGLIGADIRLEKIQKLVNRIKPFENSSAILLSNKGIYTSHPNIEFIGQSIKDDIKKDGLLQSIQNGKHLSFSLFDSNNNEFFYVFKPIFIGKTNTPWSLGVKIPMRIILDKATTTNNILLLLGFSVTVIISILIALLSRKITKPLREISKKLISLSNGEISEEMKANINTGDEIEDISISLNKMVDSLLERTSFATKIGNNDLDSKLSLLSKKDKLGQALLKMQANLSEAQQREEIRKDEDNKRQWSNQGLAKFAEILRQNNHNLKELSDIVLKEIIQYVEAIQGGLFILNNNKEQPILELISSYAYDRKKYADKTIKLGEGLVGTCAIEKLPIYLTDIPDNYVNITSGLGYANPKNIFIIPLIIDNTVFGILELASFTILEPYKKKFIEKICENIASALNSVQINIRTKELLFQSQQQAEELAAQEEEMRQNLEEMQTTQEEIMLKSQDLNSIIKAVDNSTLKAIFSTDGTLLEINDLFIKLFEIPREAMLGKKHKIFTKLSEDILAYEKFWKKLREGEIVNIIENIYLPNKKSFWLQEVYTPIFDTNGEFIKVINIAIDITQSEKQV